MTGYDAVMQNTCFNLMLNFFTVILLITHISAEYVWQRPIVDEFDLIDFQIEFKSWKELFNKKYDSIEQETEHFKIWISNWNMINNHNKHSTYTLGMNQYSDLNSTQFNKLLSHTKYHKTTMKTADQYHYTLSDTPSSIDWTNYNNTNYIPPYKNIPNCGNYGQFVLSAMSSRAAIIEQDPSKVIELSNQELVDCIPGYCNGGFIDTVYQFAEKNNGICSDISYKSTSGACAKDKCNPIDPISGYVNVEANNSSALMAAVATGPVVVGVEADETAFQFYKSGILSGNCGDRIDHQLLAVGYGSDDQGNEYWKCQNNWGDSWGENGYILICRNCNKNNGAGECGILSVPSYPVSKQ
eukprot:350052_1